MWRILACQSPSIGADLLEQDFRSETGLYSLINSQYDTELSKTSITQDITTKNASSTSPPSLPTQGRPSSKGGSIKGKDLFDSSLWKDELSTSVFYTFIASLRRKIRDEVTETTATHKFIKVLRDKKKLLRCYTQNIDGLEAREDLCMDLARGKGSRARFTKKAMQTPMSLATALPGSNTDGGCEVVQLHGDLEVLRCTICQKTRDWQGHGIEKAFHGGSAPNCPDCVMQDHDRRDRGKRGMAIGTLRPNIVLYGEEHPSADSLSSITTHDIKLAPDVLLILGTSLKVHGLKVLVREFAKAVHAGKKGNGKVIFVNLTRPPSSVWNGIIDYWVGMDCDAWVSDARTRRPDLWRRQAELDLKIVKSLQPNPIQKAKGAQVELDANGRKENLTQVTEDFKLPQQKTPRGKSRKPLSDLKVEIAKVIPKTLGLTNAKSTPKRSLKIKQLPTPPDSGRSKWGRGPLSKEMGSSGTDAVMDTPSKRRKTSVVVWEDDELAEYSDANNLQENRNSLAFPGLSSTTQMQAPSAEQSNQAWSSVARKRRFAQLTT